MHWLLWLTFPGLFSFVAPDGRLGLLDLMCFKDALTRREGEAMGQKYECGRGLDVFLETVSQMDSYISLQSSLSYLQSSLLVHLIIEHLQMLSHCYFVPLFLSPSSFVCEDFPLRLSLSRQYQQSPSCRTIATWSPSDLTPIAHSR